MNITGRVCYTSCGVPLIYNEISIKGSVEHLMKTRQRIHYIIIREWKGYKRERAG